MKTRPLVRAAAGIALLLAGWTLARTSTYTTHSVIADAGGCRMALDIVERKGTTPQGSVVLFHGLSANKKVMSYIAEGFAWQGLRVFVPDFPGHGRTPGPFSPSRADSCAESLARELIARRAILTQRTIFAGHSMGGAIALRLASRIPVAGVLAISPAPMGSGHGVSPELVPFADSVPMPPHSLVVSAAWEPQSMRAAAAGLFAGNHDPSSRYFVAPTATHVSLIFDSGLRVGYQKWAASLWHLEYGDDEWPRGLWGCLAGLAGLAVLSGSFLREAIPRKPATSISDEPSKSGITMPLLQVATVSGVGVLVLRAGVPLRFIRIFEGDYLASFLLVAGGALLVWNWKLAARLALPLRPVLGAVFAALVLVLLYSAWFNVTFYEVWLTPARWQRFPVVLLALLPWHLAEELLIGPPKALSGWRRLLFPLWFPGIAWLALTAGLFLLHSGEILLVLLALYFAVFFVLQRLAMDVVRRETGSPAAAAVFGAILLAGFCVVIFPLT